MVRKARQLLVSPGHNGQPHHSGLMTTAALPLPLPLLLLLLLILILILSLLILSLSMLILLLPRHLIDT